MKEPKISITLTEYLEYMTMKKAFDGDECEGCPHYSECFDEPDYDHMPPDQLVDYLIKTGKPFKISIFDDLEG